MKFRKRQRQLMLLFIFFKLICIYSIKCFFHIIQQNRKYKQKHGKSIEWWQQQRIKKNCVIIDYQTTRQRAQNDCIHSIKLFADQMGFIHLLICFINYPAIIVSLYNCYISKHMVDRSYFYLHCVYLSLIFQSYFIRVHDNFV